jgi:hypothetical protein
MEAAPIDLIVIEAKKKHLDEVAHLLFEWSGELKEILDKQEYEVICPVESMSLFPSMLTHCPNVSKIMLECYSLRVEYEKIQNKILQDVPVKLPFYVTGDYRKGAIISAIRIYEMDDEHDNMSDYTYDEREGGWIEEIYLNVEKTRIKIGMRDSRIYIKKPEKSIYNEIVDNHRYLVSCYYERRGIKKLSQLRKQLAGLQQNLLTEISSCYDGKSYIKQKCDICPGR